MNGLFAPHASRDTPESHDLGPSHRECSSGAHRESARTDAAADLDSVKSEVIARFTAHSIAFRRVVRRSRNNFVALALVTETVNALTMMLVLRSKGIDANQYRSVVWRR